MTRKRDRISTTQEGMDVVLLDGRDACIEFCRTTAYYWENYGADADGNRGVQTLMLDTDEWSDVRITLYDKDGDTDGYREQRLVDFSPEQQEAIHHLLDAYLDHTPPSSGEEYEEEGDYDDIDD